MEEEISKNLLINDLKLPFDDIYKLEIFKNLLLSYNAKYNLISKKTEKMIWSRHILDSAQLLNHYDNKIKGNLVDLGTGAGFPGLILAICNKNKEFHVKLYEKSPVKRQFLELIKKEINIEVEILDNVYDDVIDADIIVSRAFKKLKEIIQISREMVKKPHKIIILKGKNAQDEINNVSLDSNYSYILESSITDPDSKIIVINVKNEHKK